MEQVEITIFIILVSAVLLIFIIGTVVFIFQFRERKIKHDVEKKRMHDQFDVQLLHSRVKTQEDTMRFIGEEIHDSVAQKITLATIYTHKVGMNPISVPLQPELDNILKVLDDAIEELRELSKNLTDQRLQEADIVSLLQTEAERIISTGRCKAILEVNIHIPLKPTTKIFLLRIIQEFIQNSLKHSKCNVIKIVLTEHSDHFQLKIEDDGIGFDTNDNKNKGSGLNNMRRRTQMLGATYIFDSQLNKGTSLIIKIEKSKL
ncbi:sensor histidine kinase [Gynurincola endophyticus]|uniref:sensor histidine kinase n=1 Tax=Gynurincola endophyticus TaxID=2479004 RepID=UPI000F8CC1DD|nr:ATP-binding protein [Gynurincola endophyticus]